MTWKIDEILEILRMTEVEHLDIRTTTLGISLRDCVSDSLERTRQAVYEKITRRAEKLIQVATSVEQELGIAIVNKRIAITPLAIMMDRFDRDGFIQLAHTLDQAADRVGVDYLAGFGALVQKGCTPGDLALIDAIPEALGSTKHITGFINVASTKAGINMDMVARMGHTIKDLAQATADTGGLGCAKFVVFANAVEDNPFVAGAFHGISEPEAVINVGISGPGVVLDTVKAMSGANLQDLGEGIKRTAFKITRAGDLIGRTVANRLDVPFGIVDLSLAPTPAEGDSVADILKAMGLEDVGGPGSTAALALLNDAVKKGGAMASRSVGGLSGAFIPVSEDQGMIRAVQAGHMSLEKLEAMTAVCSVGLDMIAVPGDTPAETLAALIADECAIGMINSKTTAVRVIPVPGMQAGEIVHYGGLLGSAPVMPVSRLSAKTFIGRGGRIQAPLQSLSN
ncbi:MAG: PFL family protein [Candidatus Marinimicrobia bacterium]|nr:PFL family protein [Candidatus Neomarinimicrobiota bacterium]MCF7839488.1 PFL family protein [Candidatus Neomarinimicrobiota bacterium]MCF7902284.1 PFL family protein [Candidatus Neomarinimicrobiota bacterium]